MNNKKKSYKQKSKHNLIEESFIKVGVELGDTVLVHSDSTAAREITGLKWADALNLLKDCFLNVLGKSGTLIVPTFNWDFCNGKPYVHEKTRSQVGMFTNNVLFDDRSIRSFHPIYSFAAIGPKKEEILNNISKSSFGNDSVFSRLHKLNAKVVFFNISFEEFTFIHYVEQCKGVSYRFLKNFTGEVTVDNKKYIDTYDFYVRYLDKNIERYFGKLSSKLFSINKMHKVFLNDKYPILLSRCDDVYNFAMQGMESDPYYLLKYPPAQSVDGGKND